MHSPARTGKAYGHAWPECPYCRGRMQPGGRTPLSGPGCSAPGSAALCWRTNKHNFKQGPGQHSLSNINPTDASWGLEAGKGTRYSLTDYRTVLQILESTDSSSLSQAMPFSRVSECLEKEHQDVSHIIYPAVLSGSWSAGASGNEMGGMHCLCQILQIQQFRSG